MRALSFVISVPLAVFCILFALSNPEAVTVALWPLTKTYNMALATVGVTLLLTGFVLGAAFVAILAQGLRYRYWQERRKTERLEKELAAQGAAQDTIKVSEKKPTTESVVPAPTASAASRL